MAYGDFKYLAKRTAAGKVLRDKAFKTAADQKYDEYQRGLASMLNKFFDKKSQQSGLANNKENIQLTDELHKPNMKFEKRKVCSSFRNNIWGADLAEMQLLSKFNKRFRFLLCVLNIFSKYAWVIPLKDKKGIVKQSIVNGFQKIINNSKRKPNIIWVDKGSEFYNNSFKKWLKDNDVVMYSTNNKGKSVVAERFIRTLKNQIFKYMTVISKKCVY